MLTTAGSSDVGVIDRVTGTVNCADTLSLELSVTVTVKAASNAVAGTVVPVGVANTPVVLLRDSHGGKFVADHV